MNLSEALTPPKIDLQPVEDINAYRNRLGSEYIRKAAAVLKTAFEVTGETDSPTYLMYSALLKNPEHTTGNMKLASIAMQALGKVTHQTYTLEKVSVILPVVAARALGALRTAGNAAFSVIPDAAKTVGMVGGAGGALAFNSGSAKRTCSPPHETHGCKHCGCS